MNKIIAILGFFLISNIVSAQNTERKTYKIRPYGVASINLLSNESIQSTYQTKSVLFYGGGIIYGFAEDAKILPKIEFTYSSFMIDSSYFMPNSGSFESPQISIGFYTPLLKKDNYILQASADIRGGLFLNNQVSYNYTYTGMSLGISVNKKLSNRIHLLFGVEYCYRKIMEINFQRDLDATELKLSITF